MTVSMSSNILAEYIVEELDIIFIRNTGNETDASSVLCPWSDMLESYFHWKWKSLKSVSFVNIYRVELRCETHCSS